MKDTDWSGYEHTDIRIIREMWMWRSAVIFLLCVMLVLYFIDSKIRSDQREFDIRERAEHWQKIEDGVKANASLLSRNVDSREMIAHMQSEEDAQASIKTMILKNYDAILRVDEHLRQCSGCHSHPTVVLPDGTKVRKRPIN